ISRAPGWSGRGPVRLAGGPRVSHRDGDHRRSQDAPIQNVTACRLSDDRHLRLSGRADAGYGLVARRIEGLPHRIEGRDPELLEHSKELALDQLDSGRDGGGGGPSLARLKRPLEVVEDGQDL